MERRVRYELLENEEEHEPAQPVPLMAVSPPPPEVAPEAPPAAVTTGAAPDNTDEGAKAGDTVTLPPSYDLATALPSYEEAEQTKAQEEVRRLQEEQNEEASQNQRVFHLYGDMQLGTDGMFLLTFVISFLFNWIGLLASLCLSHTVAGRFGALAGFGLSMVKWVAIVKHANWASGMAADDSWLWWMLILLGFMIFFRGCFQYIRVKYQWNRLSAQVKDKMFWYF